MDDQLFQECTTKLYQLGKDIQNMLESLDNSSEASLWKVKEALQFIHNTINRP